MIYRHKIIAALERKRAAFAEFEQSFQTERANYINALTELPNLSGGELMARLTAAGVDAPGAVPSIEVDRATDGIIRFSHRFRHHQEARDWALNTLLNRTTFAADGSQIMPTKDISLPVAIVQVGWFENRHTPDGRYIKDTQLEVLTPDDLLSPTGADRQISEAEVNLRRFQLETAKLCEYLKTAEEQGGRRAEGQGSRGAGEIVDFPSAPLPPCSPAFPSWPLVFFDNTLVISFAERFKDRRAAYVESMLALLRCSEATRIPVVGYVDTTFARDLTNMLQVCFDLPPAEKIHDAILLDSLAAGEALQWGDRTPLYLCARAGILDEYHAGPDDFRRRIGFVYLKTNASLPARVDVPLWVFEAGLLDEVLDLVRAEVIVGNGYPYAIETADAVTAISPSDREVFFGLFQEFTAHQRIRLRLSRKALSKARRR